ncbi:MAG: hypothetical protein JNM21_12285 [Taibaiella sp.]|nr:hypothetical protein [Taibaiella sp.]
MLVIFIVFFCFILMAIVLTIYFIKRCKRIAINDFILPDLERHQYTLMDLKILPGQFLGFPFKQKGHWDNVIENILSDTKYNRKVYFHIVYRDIVGNTKSTTVKIHTDSMTIPYKAEYFPAL